MLSDSVHGILPFLLPVSKKRTWSIERPNILQVLAGNTSSETVKSYRMRGTGNIDEMLLTWSNPYREISKPKVSLDSHREVGSGMNMPE